MGATGHIGHVLAQNLLLRGNHVRAIGRDPKKLALLKSLGADPISIEDFTDAGALKDAFHRAEAVFSFIPPNHITEDYSSYQDQVGEAIKSAVKKSKVAHVLNLSSIGAEIPEGTGPIAGLYRHEMRLNSLSGVSVLHLRPGYFMENLLWSIDSIKNAGILLTPLKEDLPIPMVAAADIGKKATEFMDRLDFRGHNFFEFVGPRDVTMKEAAPVLGAAIGKPDLKYSLIAYDEAGKAMLASGMKPKMIELMLQLYRAFNSGHIKNSQRITPEHRGKTTIEDFAKEFAHAYKRELKAVKTS